jgi:predicted Zn-ribbon and HTH transcriptional regulator
MEETTETPEAADEGAEEKPVTPEELEAALLTAKARGRIVMKLLSEADGTASDTQTGGLTSIKRACGLVGAGKKELLYGLARLIKREQCHNDYKRVRSGFKCSKCGGRFERVPSFCPDCGAEVV